MFESVCFCNAIMISQLLSVQTCEEKCHHVLLLSLLNITVEHALNTTGIVASMIQNQNDADDANISTRAVAMFRNLPLLPNMAPKHSSIELSLRPQVRVERVFAELSPLYSAFWWEASALRSCGARFKTIQNGNVDKYMIVVIGSIWGWVANCCCALPLKIFCGGGTRGNCFNTYCPHHSGSAMPFFDRFCRSHSESKSQEG